MDRRTNIELLDNWIQRHGPGGLSKLAVRSQVSSSTIEKARATGEAPKKLSTLQRLSEATGIDLDVLFPSAATEERAS